MVEHDLAKVGVASSSLVFRSAFAEIAQLVEHDRQDRKRTKAQRIYLNYQYAKVRLSDPGSSFILQAVWQPLRQCLMSVRWLSLRPLGNIFKLIGEYPSLRRWRAESCSKGAFMND